MRGTPCILVSGYLGAGKTTLINAFLRAPHGLTATVLVNDFGKINIDADLIENSDGETISLTNGCACCSIGDSLLETANRVMMKRPRPDLVIVEASGVAKPDRLSFLLLGVAGLDPARVVTSVDASQACSSAHDKFISGLFRNQIKSADFVAVNRVNSPQDGRFIEGYLEQHAPQTVRIAGLHQAVDSKATSRPSVSQMPDFETGRHDHAEFATQVHIVPENFSIADVERWVKELPTSVHRVKGFVRGNLPGQPEAVFLVSRTRGEVSITETDTSIDQTMLGKIITIAPREMVER
ncbi:CobW family GTP-binding protein [Pukyongiella litopenaei]|uniref:CobW/HypB/UreG nucleotide-binding domain-containing protein n=1 Tax=Pukyongiella litopenaei TaxID=2605946 RepID=A0A5C2H7A7_9RHOB|nr:GTP-binding protein [Pukyongiella litopenaei]QEP30603.1 hypothetical protein C6Y53_20600 [Pukyongiella litopenaei]